MKRKKISEKVKRELFFEFGGLCAYSGTPLEDDWEVDHIKPVSHYHSGNPNDMTNLMPVQKIINHYKRGLMLEDFKSWYLGNLHVKLAKLPKNPRSEKSKKHCIYMRRIAKYFDITKDKPFCGKLWFELSNKPKASKATISKELFIASINAIKRQREIAIKKADALSAVFPNAHTANLLDTPEQLEDAIINLLEDATGNRTTIINGHKCISWIRYYIDEVRLGESPMPITINKQKRTLTTPQDLWEIVKDIKS
jgi:hypothetical protein